MEKNNGYADTVLIANIVDRAYDLFRKLDMSDFSKREKIFLMMDIDHAHKQIELDLVAFYEADDDNFMHDIMGIVGHMNRSTKQIEGDYVPRFALQG